MARIEPRQVQMRGGTPVLIRSTEIEDAASVVALDRNVAETGEFNVRTVEEREWNIEKMREWVRERLESPGGLAIVAVVPAADGEPSDGGGGTIIGGLGFTTARFERLRHHGHFGIGVHADWRGRGVGEHLVRTLIEWARAHEFIERIDLGVFAENHPARALYRKLGFVDGCIREREFRYGPGRYGDDVQMSLWVK
ncbi:MAG: GNAT family N-acetyltransferase [Phycisphaerales bacterium]|nr:GNAT family N-acetyltransferase [Phycisphaerales bacterium]